MSVIHAALSVSSNLTQDLRFVYDNNPTKLTEFTKSIFDNAIYYLKKDYGLQKVNESCAPILWRASLLSKELGDAINLYKLFCVLSYCGEFLASSTWQGLRQGELKQRLYENLAIRKDAQAQVSDATIDAFLNHLNGKEKVKLRQTLKLMEGLDKARLLQIMQIVRKAIEQKKGSGSDVQQEIGQKFALFLEEQGSIENMRRYLTNTTQLPTAHPQAGQASENQVTLERIVQQANPNLNHLVEHLDDLALSDPKQHATASTKAARVFFELAIIGLASSLDLISGLQWLNERKIIVLSPKYLERMDANTPWLALALCVTTLVESGWSVYHPSENASYAALGENASRAALAFELHKLAPMRFVEPLGLAIDFTKTVCGFTDIAQRRQQPYL